MTVLKAFPTPKTTYNLKKLERDILKAVDKTTKVMERDFKKTTRTWDTKVQFEQVAAARDGDDLVGAIGTDNRIYLFVTRGTKAHVITAKAGGVLAYPSGYRRKTRPGILKSYRGGGFGRMRFSKSVKHPGNKPRDFEHVVANKHQRTLEDNVSQAISKTVEKPNG